MHVIVGVDLGPAPRVGPVSQVGQTLRVGQTPRVGPAADAHGGR